MSIGQIGDQAAKSRQPDNQQYDQILDMISAHDYEGVLRLGLRRMTMVRINAVPYAHIAAEIASDCPADIKRKYPYALLRLAYELYMAGMINQFDRLMDEIEAMVPALPLPQEERRHLKGEWLIVSALPVTRDVFATAEIYGRAAALLNGPSRVIDSSDSITAALHGFPALYLMKPGTAETLRPAISRVSSLFSLFTGETVFGLEELYDGSLAHYRGDIEEAKRLICKAIYLMGTTRQYILQISAGELLAFIAVSQMDADCFAEALDYMNAAVERSGNDAVCRGVVDLCRCGLLNTLAPCEDTPGWLKDFSLTDGTLQDDHFGEVALCGNPYFAPSSSVVAFWHHTIYLMQSRQHTRALAVSEIMLQRLRDVPVLTICFCLASACCHLALGGREKALLFVEQAVALALPDKLYMLLSDFSLYLDGMVEQTLQRQSPDTLKLIHRTNHMVACGLKALKAANAKSQLPDSLTRRERDVAMLAVQSMRNADIAEALGISANTVKAHLKSVYDKLSIDKRSRIREKLK